jgi:hypothetical protein
MGSRRHSHRLVDRSSLIYWILSLECNVKFGRFLGTTSRESRSLTSHHYDILLLGFVITGLAPAFLLDKLLAAVITIDVSARFQNRNLGRVGKVLATDRTHE